MQKNKNLENFRMQSFKLLILTFFFAVPFWNKVYSQSVFEANIICDKGEIFLGSTPANRVSRDDCRQGLWILSSCQDSAKAVFIQITELDSTGTFRDNYFLNGHQPSICECKQKNLKVYISAYGNYDGDNKSGMWNYFDREGKIIALSLFKEDILQQASIFRDSSLGAVDFIHISKDESNYDVYMWSNELMRHQYEQFDYDTVMEYLVNNLMRSK